MYESKDTLADIVARGIGRTTTGWIVRISDRAYHAYQAEPGTIVINRRAGTVRYVLVEPNRDGSHESYTLATRARTYRIHRVWFPHADPDRGSLLTASRRGRVSIARWHTMRAEFGQTTKRVSNRV